MKITTLALLLTISFAVPNLNAQGAHPTGRQLMQRPGEPDYVKIEDADADLSKAVQKARKSVGKFIKALGSPNKEQSRFAVKKPFVQGEKVEHIWLRDVTYDGKVFHGVVDNVPNEITGVRLNDKVTAAPGEISDWMYVENGALVGGYTTRALCSTLSPANKRQFCKQAGFRIE